MMPQRERSAHPSIIAPLLVVLAALAACTEKQQQEIVDDTAEIAARNAAAAAGTAAFEREGLEVSDVLGVHLELHRWSREAERHVHRHQRRRQASSRSRAMVSAREEDISVDAIRGSFVGTVDGEEVFAEDCLGDRC